MPAPSPSQGRRLLAPALPTPRQGTTPAPSLLTSLDNARWQQKAAAGYALYPLSGSRRQGAAAGCALYALRGRAAAGTGRRRSVFITTYAAHNKRGQRRGGKVPPPSAHANAPPGGVRRLALASHGWSAKPFMQCISKAASPFMRRIDKAMSPFTRRTISAVSAANECEEITCGSK